MRPLARGRSAWHYVTTCNIAATPGQQRPRSYQHYEARRMVVAPRVGALALVLQNTEDEGFLYAHSCSPPDTGRGWGRGPQWMMTTIPGTPIWGKTPETYTPVWLACQGVLPKMHTHGRPPITPNRSISHDFLTFILILSLSAIGRSYPLRRGCRTRWPAHPGGGLAPCAAPPRGDQLPYPPRRLGHRPGRRRQR